MKRNYVVVIGEPNAWDFVGVFTSLAQAQAYIEEDPYKGEIELSIVELATPAWMVDKPK